VFQYINVATRMVETQGVEACWLRQGRGGPWDKAQGARPDCNEACILGKGLGGKALGVKYSRGGKQDNASSNYSRNKNNSANKNNNKSNNNYKRKK
jgi:hypothetical protein